MTVLSASAAFFGTIAAALALRAAAHLAIRLALAAPRVAETETPALLGLAYETVRIPTANQKTLHGWLIPAAGEPAAPAPAVIVLHGWGGNAQLMLPLANPLSGAGLATLFIDARCHGRSDGDGFASLPRFAEDLSAAYAWLAARSGVDPARIAVLGHSIGAAAALLAAAEHIAPAAVVSIASFAHPASIIDRWLAAGRIPAALWPYVLGYVERLIERRFDDIAPVRSIARVRCPVLLVHGEHDKRVPLADALRLREARRNGVVELLTLPGDHIAFDALERQLAAVAAFLLRHCAGGPDFTLAPPRGQRPPLTSPLSLVRPSRPARVVDGDASVIPLRLAAVRLRRKVPSSVV